MTQNVLIYFLSRCSRKNRINIYLNALPPNGKKDDEIGELVHQAYGGKKHVHENPKGRRKEVSDVE